MVWKQTSLFVFTSNTFLLSMGQTVHKKILGCNLYSTENTFHTADNFMKKLGGQPPCQVKCCIKVSFWLAAVYLNFEVNKFYSNLSFNGLT